MIKYLIIPVCLIFLGCDPSGMKENETRVSDSTSKRTKEDSVQVKENPLDSSLEVVDELSLDNGIKITWFEHGKGETVAYGDMLSIDYKVMLKNGEVVDGNHLLRKPHMPFMVGFGMQTKGWDIALQKLHVGDYAEIFIPSKLARGEKGIEGLIPANADNILKIRILEKKQPTRVVDGNKVWIIEENKANKLTFDEGKTIEFHTMVSSPSSPYYVNSFRTNKPFKMRLEDYGMVPGLKKALINAKKSDRMFVFVPSSQAYKSKGYQDIVKPDEDLLYNILVMNVVEE